MNEQFVNTGFFFFLNSLIMVEAVYSIKNVRKEIAAMKIKYNVV